MQSRFLKRWMLWVTPALLAGYGLTAAVVVLAPDWPRFPPLFLGAGAVTGVALGVCQAFALRGPLPSLSVVLWTIYTGCGVLLTYALVLLPNALFQVWSEWSPLIRSAAGLLAVLVLLGGIGALQWFELARHVRRAAWWILAAAVTLLTGIAVWYFFLGYVAPLLTRGGAVWVEVVVTAVGGVSMAAAMAGVSGVALAMLLWPSEDSGPG